MASSHKEVRDIRRCPYPAVIWELSKTGRLSESRVLRSWSLSPTQQSRNYHQPRLSNEVKATPADRSLTGNCVYKTLLLAAHNRDASSAAVLHQLDWHFAPKFSPKSLQLEDRDAKSLRRCLPLYKDKQHANCPLVCLPSYEEASNNKQSYNYHSAIVRLQPPWRASKEKRVWLDRS